MGLSVQGVSLTFDKSGNGKLLIKVPQELKLLRYQLAMLRHNPDPSLIAPELRREVRGEFLYYSLPSRLSLSEYLEGEKVFSSGTAEILERTITTVQDGKCRLLYEKCYLLDPDFVFLDPATLQVELLYVPLDTAGCWLSNCREYCRRVLDLIMKKRPETVLNGQQIPEPLQKLHSYLEGNAFTVEGLQSLLAELKYCPQAVSPRQAREKPFSLKPAVIKPATSEPASAKSAVTECFSNNHPCPGHPQFAPAPVFTSDRCFPRRSGKNTASVFICLVAGVQAAAAFLLLSKWPGDTSPAAIYVTAGLILIMLDFIILRGYGRYKKGKRDPD